MSRKPRTAVNVSRRAVAAVRRELGDNAADKLRRQLRYANDQERRAMTRERDRSLKAATFKLEG